MFRGNLRFVRRNSLFRFEEIDILIDIIKGCVFGKLLFLFSQFDILIDIIKSCVFRKCQFCIYALFTMLYNLDCFVFVICLLYT